MEKVFDQILHYFQNKQPWPVGDYEYNVAFCQTLTEAFAAKDASIWRLDRNRCLHMVYATGLAAEDIKGITLREGEGISGAAVLSRQPIAVADAVLNPQHSPGVDMRLGYETHAMISAPIIFRDVLYGVLNILNTISGEPFHPDHHRYISAAATLYAASLDIEGRLIPFSIPPHENGSDSSDEEVPERHKTVIVGISPAVQEALDICLKTGKMDVPVLICGETGTGKELAARRIHEAGSRADGPFVEVNCAALPDTLLESELFGHVKGAFTGANRSRHGKFVAASGGTLFLDEIGDMSMFCQAKILRALQGSEVTPIGSEKSRKCDTRVIAATNRDLTKLVKEGAFRRDLYYRLCGIEIVMPPLRERAEDLFPLAMHFIQKISVRQRRKASLFRPPKISQAAVDMLHSYSWPGNVRQLEQAIGAAVTVCEGDEILPKDFPRWLRNAVGTDYGNRGAAVTDKYFFPKQSNGTLGRTHLQNEQGRYLKTLEKTKYSGTGRWNLSSAASMLGIPRKTFTNRLKKMGIIP